jgi:hypothetical protein
MKISEIYEKYKIMPNLKMHQYRVASVAKIIADNMNIHVDTNAIVKACLIHDMGNIIKFNLKLFPEFLEPEGYDYWKQVQDDFITNYGKNEHSAHEAIARELEVEEKVIKIIHNFGLSKAVENAAHNDYDIKIAVYSDMRVTPFDIVSLDERLSEGRKRWKKNKGHEIGEKKDFDQLKKGMIRIESQIFDKCKLAPSDINSEKVNAIIDNIKEFEV